MGTNTWGLFQSYGDRKSKRLEGLWSLNNLGAKPGSAVSSRLPLGKEVRFSELPSSSSVRRKQMNIVAECQFTKYESAWVMICLELYSRIIQLPFTMMNKTGLICIVSEPLLSTSVIPTLQMIRLRPCQHGHPEVGHIANKVVGI